jgi:hypothetical protein
MWLTILPPQSHRAHGGLTEDSIILILHSIQRGADETKKERRGKKKSENGLR